MKGSKPTRLRYHVPGRVDEEPSSGLGHGHRACVETPEQVTDAPGLLDERIVGLIVGLTPQRQHTRYVLRHVDSYKVSCAGVQINDGILGRDTDRIGSLPDSV